MDQHARKRLHDGRGPELEIRSACARAMSCDSPAGLSLRVPRCPSATDLRRSILPRGDAVCRLLALGMIL